MKYKVGDEFTASNDIYWGEDVFYVEITKIKDSKYYLYIKQLNGEYTKSNQTRFDEAWLDKYCRKLTKLEKALK